MPVLRLKNIAGAQVDTRDQFVAGDAMVCWITSGYPAAVHLDRLDRLLGEFRALDVQVFVICDRAPEQSGFDGARILIDAPGATRRAFAFLASGVVVADARGKIIAVLAGEAFEAARDLCAKNLAAEPRGVRSSGAPVLIVPDVIEADLRNGLIAYWEAGEKHSDQVATAALGQDQGRIQVKKRADVFVHDLTLLEKLRERLIQRLFPEIFRAFHFKVARFEPLRIGCYDGKTGGYFRRHRDNRTEFTMHRGFAMSLNLNTGDYEGGQLRFPEFGHETYEPAGGGAVVFCCNLLHEALPVVTGRRFAIFSFFADAAGVERENRLIAAEKAAGRKGLVIDP